MTHPAVAVVGTRSAEDRRDRRVEILRRFIVVDIAACFLAGTGVMTLALIVGSAWAVVVAIAAFIGAGTLALALIPLRRGSLSTPFWIIAGVNWGVSLVCAFVAPVAWPICVAAAFVPAAAAGLFTSARRAREVAIVSVGTATVIAALGVLQDVTEFSSQLPRYAPEITLIIGMPLVALVLVVAAQANTNELQSMVTDMQIVNDELEASRVRVVVATDAARRKIERDLHDGAQQRLVGMALQLSTAREQLRTDPERAVNTLASVRDQVRNTQADLRSLVRGVYPPVLTEHGLGPALQALCDSQTRPVRTRIDATPRLPPEVEAAGYFCALEAMQNAAKHAGPDAVIDLDLVEVAGGITFEVRDDGRGFTDEAVSGGHGFTNMVDRIGAAGGDLEILSEIGVGTTVRATLPSTWASGSAHRE